MGTLTRLCLHGEDFSECPFSAPGPGSGCHLRQSGARQRASGWEGPAPHPGCSQRCPGSLRARVRRAPCSSGHGPSSTERYLCLHSASDPSGGRLAGVEREKGREGRERASAVLAAQWGQEPPPSPTCACTRTCTCAHRPANTHTCVHGPSRMCTIRYAHGPALPHIHTCAHGPLHARMQTDLYTWSLHVCVHTHSPCFCVPTHT